MQNKANQGRKVVSPALERVAKWEVFVLNRVGVCGPRRHTSTQISPEYPSPRLVRRRILFKGGQCFDHLQYFTLNTIKWLSLFTNLSLYNIGSFVKILFWGSISFRLLRKFKDVTELHSRITMWPFTFSIFPRFSSSFLPIPGKHKTFSKLVTMDRSTCQQYSWIWVSF